MEMRSCRALLDEVFRLARGSLCAVPARDDWRLIEGPEIRALESEGCRSPDWSRVRLSARADLRGICDCRFEEDVFLDAVPGGRIRSSTLRNCSVHGTSIVESVGLLEGYDLLEGSEVSHCGVVRSGRGAHPGTGMLLQLGCETGERALRAIPTLSVGAALALTSGDREPGSRASYEAEVDRALAVLSGMARGFIGSRASIRCTQLVEDTLLGDECSIEAACSVRGTFMLGGPGEGSRIADGSAVRLSALQWGASVDSLSVVSCSVVGERAVVEKSARLTDSLLGPDCVHASGEITASLVGPQVAAHHSSLLIAARWPEGCGNVGYGANVGSNHTSRLPDQEISIGAGVFFGLGCSVKFPCNLDRAPGTIVATGVVMPPQKLEFPFSLVTGPAPAGEGRPQGMLELRPGWVLYGNLFSLLRNARKLEARHRAKKSSAPEGPSGQATLGLVLEARERLRSARASAQGFYTAKELPGAGECFVTEESRKKALEGYGLFAAWRILGSYAASLASDGHGAPPACGYPGTLFGTEFEGLNRAGLLEAYEDTIRGMIELARDSRSRDYSRGASILEDYADAHVPPDRDPILADVLGALEEELAGARASRAGTDR